MPYSTKRGTQGSITGSKTINSISSSSMLPSNSSVGDKDVSGWVESRDRKRTISYIGYIDYEELLNRDKHKLLFIHST